MLIVFVLDTSVSMHQRSLAGLSALDAAKMSIEHFIKGLYSARLESAAGAHRFALVASDAVRLASHIQTLLEEKHSAEGLRKDLDLMEKNLHAQRKGSNKAPEVLLDGEELNFHLSDGWFLDASAFLEFVKNLPSSHALTDIGSSLRRAFELLNMTRLATLQDTPNLGRCPWVCDSAMIVLLTDGTPFTTPDGVQTQLLVPESRCPGMGYFFAPFRWDQRLFALNIKFPGVADEGAPPIDPKGRMSRSPSDEIASMCRDTGGQSYVARDLKQLLRQVDELVTVFAQQRGVMVHMISEELEKHQNGLNYLHVPGRTGHWPMPEGFLVPMHSENLIVRQPHPAIRVASASSGKDVANIPEGLPFDKYQLEPSPLTRHVLVVSRNFLDGNPNQPPPVFRAYVENSDGGGRQSFGSSFGFLKANSNLTAVNLYVLPYNYPDLFEALAELHKTHRPGAPPVGARGTPVPPRVIVKLKAYVSGVPAYYMHMLRQVFRSYGPVLDPVFQGCTELCTSSNGFVPKRSLLLQAKSTAEINRCIDMMAFALHPAEPRLIWRNEVPGAGGLFPGSRGHTTSRARNSRQLSSSSSASLSSSSSVDSGGASSSSSILYICPGNPRALLQKLSELRRELLPAPEFVTNSPLDVSTTTSLLVGSQPSLKREVHDTLWDIKPPADSQSTSSISSGVTLSSWAALVNSPEAQREAYRRAELEKHSAPIAKMGDVYGYQDRHAPQMRDPFADDEGRGQQRLFFGNPFQRRFREERARGSRKGPSLVDGVPGVEVEDEVEAEAHMAFEGDSSPMEVSSPSSVPLPGTESTVRSSVSSSEAARGPLVSGEGRSSGEHRQLGSHSDAGGGGGNGGREVEDGRLASATTHRFSMPLRQAQESRLSRWMDFLETRSIRHALLGEARRHERKRQADLEDFVQETLSPLEDIVTDPPRKRVLLDHFARLSQGMGHQGLASAISRHTSAL